MQYVVTVSYFSLVEIIGTSLIFIYDIHCGEFSVFWFHRSVALVYWLFCVAKKALVWDLIHWISYNLTTEVKTCQPFFPPQTPKQITFNFRDMFVLSYHKTFKDAMLSCCPVLPFQICSRKHFMPTPFLNNNKRKSSTITLLV